jgi:hypothetical protein
MQATHAGAKILVTKGGRSHTLSWDSNSAVDSVSFQHGSFPMRGSGPGLRSLLNIWRGLVCARCLVVSQSLTRSIQIPPTVSTRPLCSYGNSSKIKLDPLNTDSPLANGASFSRAGVA